MRGTAAESRSFAEAGTSVLPRESAGTSWRGFLRDIVEEALELLLLLADTNEGDERRGPRIGDFLGGA